MNRVHPRSTDLLDRDVSVADRVPYAALVGPGVLRTWDGSYLQCFRLQGVAFESAEGAQIASLHARLNVLWRNIAAPQVALWTHLIRREATLPVAAHGAGFAEQLAQRYAERLAVQCLMTNELYVTVVYRPTPSVATRWTLKALARRSQELVDPIERVDSLDACQKLADQLCAALAPYEIEPLGIVRREGRPYSALLEFLGLLVNGEPRAVPLPMAPVSRILGTSRLFFGTELLEIRTPVARRWGAVLGIKEYATPTVPGMFDALLAAPFPLVLTQSFAFLSKAAAQGLMQRQANRLLNAGDFARSQAIELTDALDALTANEFVMGEHHLSLQVMTPLAPESEPLRERVLARLNDDLALARTMLADSGMTVAREDLALEAAYWAQLPGNFLWRPRKAVISSRNFAAMAPAHNYPGGRAVGNHWGAALATLATAARTPYHFSLHAADPHEADGGSRKDIGHTLLVGPTGSGKTVLIGFLIAQLARTGATQVVIDKDRGLDLLVRALGGTYLPLRAGEPTGCNPLQLPVTSANTEFLREWLRVLARPRARGFRSDDQGAPELTARHSAELDHALTATLALPSRERRLSRLIEFLDATDPEGLHARLAPWCDAEGGAQAWVFDNETDTLAPLLSGVVLVGFDVTEFLELPRVRTPLTLYLFHLVRQLLDGRRLVCWMDEFWRLLADPAFEQLAKDGPKTWRKLNGVMCFATQSPSDVLASPICRTLIEQTATKVFFPNTEASADYCEGFGLTEREFRLIREDIPPGARQFLLKQGHHSVVCELDLKGLDEELAVLSGRAETVRLADELRGEWRAWPDEDVLRAADEFVRKLT